MSWKECVSFSITTGPIWMKVSLNKLLQLPLLFVIFVFYLYVIVIFNKYFKIWWQFWDTMYNNAIFHLLYSDIECTTYADIIKYFLYTLWNFYAMFSKKNKGIYYLHDNKVRWVRKPQWLIFSRFYVELLKMGERNCGTKTIIWLRIYTTILSKNVLVGSI